MLRHLEYTRTRLEQLAGRMQAKIYPESRSVEDLRVSPCVDRVSYAAAQDLEYRPVQPGEQFGPLWSTFWFRAHTTIPQEWDGRRVDLLWISHSEATLWIDGRSVQGLNHEPISWDQSSRPDAVLLSSAEGGEPLDFQVEMACNRVFGSGSSQFSSVSPFVLDRCDIAVFDPEAWDLYFDFMVLQRLEREGAKDLDPTWAGELLSELNRFANSYDPDDRATWATAHDILRPLYQRQNATTVHELSAIGHAHIDTAWLWPLGETHRKCERTFSSQATYMEQYPELKFACSQAYQYAVIQERNPDLYQRIKAAVGRGQWVPVGGTWIEPDCNLPSGEALARQFLFGQRYFKQEFGITCREFWNPDVFGYNGQLPQLMRLSGIKWFLTQKLSWNRFNRPAHHTFTWEGIDGSTVLAHFPPADTYNAVAEVAQLRENVRQYKDHDRSRHSLMLFGYGDGGGGPTKRMLEILRRAVDLEGLPRTRIRTSEAFFTLLEEDCRDLPQIVGELYFEYHRGTYTTQAATKRNNRKCEFLLHDLEFMCTVAWKLGGAPYPSDELNRLWRLLLTNQFHDILPGSSIGLVYEDAARDYAAIQQEGQGLLENALQSLSQLPPDPVKLALEKQLGPNLGVPETPELNESYRMAEGLAQKIGVPYVDLRKMRPSKDALELLPLETCRRLNAIPVRRVDNRLLLAMVDPNDVAVIDEVAGITGLAVQPALAVDKDIRAALSPGAAPAAAPAQTPAEGRHLPVNALGFRRQEVAETPDGSLAFVTAPAYGVGAITEVMEQVLVKEGEDGIVLENERLRAVLARDGRLLSLIELANRREALSGPGNILELYDDRPTAFDAWDTDPFHLETLTACPACTTCRVSRAEPLRAEVTYEREIGRNSRMTQTVRLDADSRRLEFHTEVDWQESHKLLKVAFPVNVRSQNATYEMQFGNVERPTHYNTSYDLARYEVPGHKWVDLSEYGFGVALLSESKYGFSVYGNTLRMSLLRAPEDPDPRADIGQHRFVYALMPHPRGWREAGVVAEGYRFNVPIQWTIGGSSQRSFASVDSPNLVLDTIKRAEDSEAVILRLYECHGARGVARVRAAFEFRSAVFCNLLEEDGEPAEVHDQEIVVPYRPYQIITLKLV